MNPLTNVKNLQKLNERELKLGIAGKDSKSWHQKYKDSAWVFVGGLPYDLSEGDIISVFSQYGEIVNINLVRDRESGKSRGFCFICYEDQRSTNLAVDNFNGIKVYTESFQFPARYFSTMSIVKLLNRVIRVDHVEEYKVPKERGDEDDITRNLHMEGCAPKKVKQEITKDDAVASTSMVSRQPEHRETKQIIKHGLRSPDYVRKEPKRENILEREKISPKKSLTDQRKESNRDRHHDLKEKWSEKSQAGEKQIEKKTLHIKNLKVQRSTDIGRDRSGYGVSHGKHTKDDTYVPSRYK